jgi:hypothetical protein
MTQGNTADAPSISCATCFSRLTFKERGDSS